MSDDKLYTKADMERAIAQAREGTSRKTYSEEELRAEVIKAATLASQVAARNHQGNYDALMVHEPAQPGGLLVTMGQVETAVKNAIGQALVQLFDDLRLPIATREEKQATIAKLEDVMRLNVTSRKFAVGVLGVCVTILTTVAGGFGIWLATRGALH